MARRAKRTSGAVEKVWAIFNRRPKAARKDQLEAAAAAGVNPNTAKTQYQRWLHRGKGKRRARTTA
jgi:hypothetical protein